MLGAFLGQGLHLFLLIPVQATRGLVAGQCVFTDPSRFARQIILCNLLSLFLLVSISALEGSPGSGLHLDQSHSVHHKMLHLEASYGAAQVVSSEMSRVVVRLVSCVEKQIQRGALALNKVTLLAGKNLRLEFKFSLPPRVLSKPPHCFP